MRYRLTILAVLALVDGAAGRTILAQGEPRQRVRLVGRVFDQTRRLVKGVEVTVNRREVRAVTDDAGIFQLDVLPGDSVIAFRRIGYRPMLLAMDPLPAVQDTVPVELQAIPVQLSEVIVLTHPSKPLRSARSFLDKPSNNDLGYAPMSCCAAFPVSAYGMARRSASGSRGVRNQGA